MRNNRKTIVVIFTMSVNLLLAMVMSNILVMPIKAQAEAGTCIDFDALPPGTIVSNQFPNMVVSSREPEFPPMIFDSANPTGGDFDLGAPNQAYGGPGVGDGGMATNMVPLGHILIISEDGDSSDPDDKADGGALALTFEFMAGVTITDVIVIDIEPRGSNLTVISNSRYFM